MHMKKPGTGCGHPRKDILIWDQNLAGSQRPTVPNKEAIVHGCLCAKKESFSFIDLDVKNGELEIS